MGSLIEHVELAGSLGAAKLTVYQQRIREIERELPVAKMECDILKKATAYFAKEVKYAKIVQYVISSQSTKLVVCSTLYCSRTIPDHTCRFI